MMTGHEFLPIGGFTGGAPVPTLGRIEQLAHEGEIQLALVPLDATNDPRVAWIMQHCTKVGQPARVARDRCSSRTSVASPWCTRRARPARAAPRVAVRWGARLIHELAYGPKVTLHGG